ncbi:MAG: PQQ-binding-like beta-propeller repeat protein [Myxococcota bacterium]|nr:PQQ-binding-like beta-propeller repeat protein [Myxococcota bacterium]MDW8360944.1 PQQ-binding-like beta-propeller repeat protein [Myxococcales bacterium]
MRAKRSSVVRASESRGRLGPRVARRGPAACTMMTAALMAAACGGGTSAGRGVLAPTFPDNRRPDIEAVVERVRASAPRAARSVLVGVTAEPPGIVVYDLGTRRVSWSRPGAVASLPWVAGSLVVVQERGGVLGLDLASGAERFRIDDGGLGLVGADGEGAWAALVLSTGGGVQARSRLVVLRDGEPDSDVEIEHAVGAPAVRGELVVLPWGAQNASVLEVESLRELARVRLEDDMLGTALVAGGDVLLAHRAVYLVSPQLASGSRRAGAVALTLDVGALPGEPPLLADTYRPAAPPHGAAHRVRLAWYAHRDGGSFAFSDSTVYHLFYRVVTALDPAGGAIRWMTPLDRDVVGAAAVAGGLVVVDERGRLTALRATDGAAASAGEVGKALIAARIVLDAMPPGVVHEARSTSLPDQLLEVASHPDARLVPVRSYAVAALASRGEPEVTGHLIALCEDARAAAPVRASACEALTRRNAGPSEVLAALERRASFLEGTRTPPLAALAGAAVAMGERRAVPLLLAHLRHPDTPAEAVAAIARAVSTLGDRDAVAPLGDFLRLYHADDDDPALARALVAIVEALERLAGPAAREWLEPVASDALGVAAVRQAAVEALARLQQPASESGSGDSSGGADAAGRTEPAGGPQPSEAGASDRPEVLQAEHIAAALGPVRDGLRACLRSAAGRPASARLVISVEADGSVREVTALPQSVVECMRPLVQSVRFPRTRRGDRQQVTYTVR